MKLELLTLMCVAMCCVGVRLTPLENNDKLQDITNLYVAEWQWESWPIKQELSEQEGRTPGIRKNVALWADNSRSAWYLFGGQSVNGNPDKVYSDVWRFKVKTRAWKRFFPPQGDAKGGYVSKKSGATMLRGGFFDGNNISHSEPLTKGAVLCGSIKKKNATKTKNLNEWTSFSRKKLEEDRTEELSSLAIYAPRTQKFNTVWQIDVKQRIWRTYVCYCDIGRNEDDSFMSNFSNPLKNKNKILNETVLNDTHNVKNMSEDKINNAEDEADNEQQHLSINNEKNKRKKINQTKKINEKSQLKKQNIKERGNRREKRTADESKSANQEDHVHVHVNESKTLNDSKVRTDDKKVQNVQKLKNITEKFLKEKPDTETKSKLSSKYCPEFSGSATAMSVTWCDGRNEALIAADVGSPKITVWVFNLTTSHWSQMQVKIRDGVKWPGCQNTNSIRYVGNDEDVFVICSPPEKQNESNNSSRNSTNPSEIPSKFNTKLVFRINYKEGVLRSLGRIRLNSYFNLPEGDKVWRNDTQSILKIIRNSENETILILAFLDTVDLWILNNDPKGKEGFDLIEKVWRGSALKWFDKYNAALYSLQFASESGNSQTVLLPNPRKIGVNEYWPRERGRFIIRIFRNENLKNQTFENRTREQNLTYDLLLSDYKTSGVEHQLNHMYNLKVLVFFGISLAMFTVFGFVVFLKKCVNCPPRIRVRNECHKSPLVIRYSVIPDDLLYPVA